MEGQVTVEDVQAPMVQYPVALLVQGAGKRLEDASATAGTLSSVHVHDRAKGCAASLQRW